MKNFPKFITINAIGILSLIILQTTFAEEPAKNSDLAFTDVNVNTDYKDAISWMQRNGAINGYPDHSFKPDQCVNRAEMLKMLFKILEIDFDKSKAELFPDTPADAWYAPYVRTARERNTVQGYQDGKFRPDQCVTRAEAIKMAVLEFNNNKIPPEPDSPSLTDAKDITEDKWYYKHINYAIQADIVGLNHATIIDQDKDLGLIKFYPEKEMSRKEVAEMLYRMKTIKDRDIDTFEEGYKPDALILQPAEVNFELNSIELTSNHDPKNPDNLEFSVYLERPDLGIKQNIDYEDDMVLTVDLALGLQPKLMYLSEPNDTNPDSGSMCDRPRFPHACTATLTSEDFKKTDHKYLIKITFEDDTYVAKEITIPMLKGLDRPEIVGPIETPAQNSKFDVEFKDIGADTYEVGVELCKPYNNDGINPCLDSVNYYLVRDSENNKFIITYSGNKSATVNTQNGYINVRSDIPLVFEESMSYYILASSEGKKDGATTIVKSSDNKYYPVK